MTTANTKTLIAELKWIDRFTEGKRIPVLGTVKIRVSGEFMKLTATDLETAGNTFLEVQGSENWITVVPVKALLKYLSKVEELEVKLAGSSEGLTVSHGENSITIDCNGEHIGSFPELPSDLEPVGTLANMETVIPQVEVAIAEGEGRFMLNGALLEVKAGNAVMVSTDGHRLSHVELRESDFTANSLRLIIHRRALGELSKIVKGSAVRMAQSENHVSFTVGNRTILSQKLTGNFPDYERVMPKYFKVSANVEPKPLAKLLERLNTIASDVQHNRVWLQAEAGKLAISAKNDRAKANGSVAIGSEDVWKSQLNCEYVLDFLKISQDSVTVAVKDEHAPLQFTNGSWKYVLMPLKG